MFLMEHCKMLGRGVWLLALFALSCASTPRVRTAGALRFQCDPTDARIVIDEEDVGACAVWSSRWFGLTTGVHRVRVSRDGFLPQESEILAGGRVTVTVRLRRVPD
jgi:hypothetical protein